MQGGFHSPPRFFCARGVRVLEDENPLTCPSTYRGLMTVVLPDAFAPAIKTKKPFEESIRLSMY